MTIAKSEINQYFKDCSRSVITRIFNTISQISLSELEDLHLITDVSLLAIPGCGGIVYQEIRKIFPFEESESATLGQKLGLNLLDAAYFANKLGRTWSIDSIGLLNSYLWCHLYRLPEIDPERFTYVSPYNAYAQTQKLDWICQSKNAKAMSFFIVAALDYHAYVDLATEVTKLLSAKIVAD